MATKKVTATDANRRFSELLGDIQRGETFVVTSHGEPVATLAPATDRSRADRLAARQRLFARLRRQPSLNLPRWTRDELYDD
jgi:prevent-host-death family protein